MPVLSPAYGIATARYFTILCCVLILAVLAVIAALAMGSVAIPLSEVIRLLISGHEQSLNAEIVLGLRLPRVLGGFFVGGMLALAGCLMQVLLRNPLAEPYVLGVSGGAAVFALVAILSGLGGFWISGSAFAGALFSILLVFVLSRIGGDWNPLRILLTGVVVAAGWGAVISLLLAVSPASQVHGMLFWLMGDLGYTQYSLWSPCVLLVVLLLCVLGARSMNLLARGELYAAALGVPVHGLKYLIYFSASLLTAAAVMQAGSIGFIGLVIPHLGRLLFGGDYRLLFPVSVLLGGSLLVIADGLARTLIAPQQLPAGVLTAMIGVPLFLVLLQTVAIRQRP